MSQNTRIFEISPYWENYSNAWFIKNTDLQAINAIFTKLSKTTFNCTPKM